VDLVPDPLILRESGSTGNRTQGLWTCNHELWPLDGRGGHISAYIFTIFSTQNTKSL
jgi:hypothetical protein